jgi:hypothetical protein
LGISVCLIVSELFPYTSVVLFDLLGSPWAIRFVKQLGSGNVFLFHFCRLPC